MRTIAQIRAELEAQKDYRVTLVGAEDAQNGTLTFITGDSYPVMATPVKPAGKKAPTMLEEYVSPQRMRRIPLALNDTLIAVIASGDPSLDATPFGIVVFFDRVTGDRVGSYASENGKADYMPEYRDQCWLSDQCTLQQAIDMATRRA